MKVWYSCRNHYADGILNSRWSTQGRMQCWCVDPTEPNFVFVFFGSATCCCNFGCEYSFFMLPYCSWTSAAKPEKMEDLRGARSKVGSCPLIHLRFCIPSRAEAMLSVVWLRAGSCDEPSEVLLEWCFPALLAHCWTLPLFLCHSQIMRPWKALEKLLLPLVEMQKL